MHSLERAVPETYYKDGSVSSWWQARTQIRGTTYSRYGGLVYLQAHRIRRPWIPVKYSPGRLSPSVILVAIAHTHTEDQCIGLLPPTTLRDKKASLDFVLMRIRLSLRAFLKKHLVVCCGWLLLSLILPVPETPTVALTAKLAPKVTSRVAMSAPVFPSCSGSQGVGIAQEHSRPTSRLWVLSWYVGMNVPKRAG